MTDSYPPALQRHRLTELAAGLNCSYAALRRDEYGDWRINGKYGHVYAVPGMTVHGLPPGEGFQFYCQCASKQAWTWAKKAMFFAVVTQDSDEEGMLFLNRMPLTDEADIIRSYLGIRKRTEYSDEVLAQKRAAMLNMKGALREKPASDDPPASS
jgi:hypothetical protein